MQNKELQEKLCYENKNAFSKTDEKQRKEIFDLCEDYVCLCNCTTSQSECGFLQAHRLLVFYIFHFWCLIHTDHGLASKTSSSTPVTSDR